MNKCVFNNDCELLSHRYEYKCEVCDTKYQFYGEKDFSNDSFTFGQISSHNKYTDIKNIDNFRLPDNNLSHLSYYMISTLGKYKCTYMFYPNLPSHLKNGYTVCGDCIDTLCKTKIIYQISSKNNI
jgi:hypothetical protein